jgi:acetyltransferase-like isoleucine patch superfamily enzyme
MKGPTIRRGARVGGGAILCPGVEIGEDAFVGAGAVVTKDVPRARSSSARPARVLRDVPTTSCSTTSSRQLFENASRYAPLLLDALLTTR